MSEFCTVYACMPFVGGFFNLYNQAKVEKEYKLRIAKNKTHQTMDTVLKHSSSTQDKVLENDVEILDLLNTRRSSELYTCIGNVLTIAAVVSFAALGILSPGIAVLAGIAYAMLTGINVYNYSHVNFNINLLTKKSPL